MFVFGAICFIRFSLCSRIRLYKRRRCQRSAISYLSDCVGLLCLGSASCSSGCVCCVGPQRSVPIFHFIQQFHSEPRTVRTCCAGGYALIIFASPTSWTIIGSSFFTLWGDRVVRILIRAIETIALFLTVL